MNKARRKKLADIISSLEELSCATEEIQEEEQEAFDNLPESLQDSEKGTLMSDCIDSVESAFDSINEAIERLQEAIQ